MILSFIILYKCLLFLASQIFIKWALQFLFSVVFFFNKNSIFYSNLHKMPITVTNFYKMRSTTSKVFCYNKAIFDCNRYKMPFVVSIFRNWSRLSPSFHKKKIILFIYFYKMPLLPCLSNFYKMGLKISIFCFFLIQKFDFFQQYL